MKTACVFAHFDRDGKVDEYVIYYLQELQKIVGLIQFVTTSELHDAELRKVESLGVKVIQRNNEGYDFYSYKLGIEAIDLSQFDELIVCNDSVYGPFSKLATVFSIMRSRGAKFWGMTDSYDYQHHLQSYFLVFTRDVFDSSAFGDFWRSVRILDEKEDIIRRYEVGLSQSIAAAGFRLEAFAGSRHDSNASHIRSYWRYYFRMFLRRWTEKKFWVDGLGVISGQLQVGKNVAHLQWKSLIEESGVPFIKVGLLRENPKDVDDLDEVYDVIKRVGEYPVDLIKEHLRRTSEACTG